MHLHAESTYVDNGFDALDYGYADTPQQAHMPRRGERELWCAVIAQAFVDIGVIVPHTSDGRPRIPRADPRRFDEALRWLLRDKNDFAYICELAGVSPQIIRSAALCYYQQLVNHS